MHAGHEGKKWYLVVTDYQVLLVEPDKDKMGYAVVSKAAPLPNIDPAAADPSSLTIIYHSDRLKKGATVWTLQLAFDNNVQCMAAKHALERGRSQLKTRKMQAMAHMIGIDYAPEELNSRKSSSAQ